VQTVAAVVDVVRHHVAAGELDHVLYMLPGKIRAVVAS
jgi:uncharacterized protein (DUF2267 family)